MSSTNPSPHQSLLHMESPLPDASSLLRLNWIEGMIMIGVVLFLISVPITIVIIAIKAIRFLVSLI